VVAAIVLIAVTAILLAVAAANWSAQSTTGDYGRHPVPAPSPYGG